MEKTKAENARAGLTGGREATAKSASSTNKVDQRARKRAEAEARNARSRGRRGVEKEVQRLEREIQSAESKITELTMELEKPETYDDASRAMAINRDLTRAQSTLDSLTPEWEAATLKLDELR